MSIVRDHEADADRAELHRLGYAQELLRTMGGFSNFAISFSIISVLTGAVILFNYGMAMAGPAAVGIGWPIVSLFTLLVAAAMAELASVWPTAGGLYYWAVVLRDRRWGWWVAWLNLGGQVSVVAGIDYAAAIYLCATLLEPAFGIGPNTETLGLPNALWVTGILMAIQTVFAIAGSRIVARINDLSVWWHIAFVAAVVLCLAFLGTLPANPLAFAYTIAPGGEIGGVPVAEIVPLGIAGAFLLSLLQSQWTLTGYDASAHVAEETRHARVASGWGVFLSVAVSAVAGYLLLMALVLRMPPVEQVLNESIGGYAVHDILVRNLGAAPGLGGILSAGIAVAMVFCGFSSVAAASRMLYAFSRDDGIPGSHVLKRVHRRWRTPANATIALTVSAWLLLAGIYVALGALGGDPGFLIAGVTGVSTVLLYWAYGACIWLGLRSDGTWRRERGWSLGRASRPVAWVAVAWIVFLTPVLLWPVETYNPAALLTVVLFLGFLVAAWRLRARDRFRGPAFLRDDAALAAIEADLAADAPAAGGSR